jgi:hypothetical protein
MISNATFNALDIQARVSLFYNSLAIFLLALFVFGLVAYGFHKLRNGILNSAENKIVNYSSFAGIIYFLFRIFGFEVTDGLEFVFFLHKLMPVAALIGIFIRRKEIPVSVYTIILTLSASLYFFVSDILILNGSGTGPDFWIVSFIIGLLLIITTNLFFGTQIPLIVQKTEIIVYSLVPLAFAPFASLLKDEIFLIFKGKGMDVAPTPIFICIWIILIAIIFFRYKRISKNVTKQNQLSFTSLVGKSYFPLFIFSIVSYTFYSHYFLRESMQDMFEPANHYLPIMEFSKWGTVPVIEKFNSHVLSDIVFSGIYAFFNDIKVNDLELYDFLHHTFMAILYYYLIRVLTRSPYIALYVILFFPFYYALCPYEHAFAALGIVVFYKILEEKQTIRNYILLFSTLVFLILWRIDVGFPCLLILPPILFYYHFNSSSFRINFKTMFKALAITGIVFSGITIIISALRGVNLFAKVPYILNYISSAQTYGYTSTGDANMASYKMHYYIFPVCVALIFIYMLIKFRELSKTKPQRLAFLALMVICGYYFINFQRGLVRHSFIERIDSLVSSFIYIILAGSVFIFLYKQKGYVKTVLVVLVLFFSLLNYKLPSVNGSVSVFETTMSKLLKPVTNLDTLKSRTIISFTGDSKLNDKKEVISFLNHNLKENETFIDFTNTSLLYFYTGKPTPSYFYQNPICSHNDWLQDKFIEDLKDYNTPYLLFDFVKGPNHMDEVPNNFRHYRMAEYFYKTFEPDTIIEEVRIWRRINSTAHKSKQDTITDRSVRRYKKYELVKLPYIWGNFDSKGDEKKLYRHKDTATISSYYSRLQRIPLLDKSSGNTLLLKLKNLSDKDHTLSLFFGSVQKNDWSVIKFTVLKSEATLNYAIRISACYSWIHEDVNHFWMTAEEENKVKLEEVIFTKGN